MKEHVMTEINKRCLKTLEFPKILSMLEECASSAYGKSLCKSLKPSIDFKTIKSSQKDTADALSFLWKKGKLSFSGIKDIRQSALLLKKGASLNTKELRDIASLLKQTESAIKYFDIEETKEPDTGNEVVKCKDVTGESENNNSSFIKENSFYSYISSLVYLPDIVSRISSAIISEDEIADDASPTLKHIRRQIKLSEDKIHSSLSAILAKGTEKDYLRDNIITMRNGRYCVPVKSEHKNKIPGMIHDQSSKGSTYFIEPLEIVKLNNEISELYSKEKEEITVILNNLSAYCMPYYQNLLDDFDALVNLDFIFAKANLAKNLKCVNPDFTTNRIINIKSARHPLLDKDKVVPIDIRLGEDFNLLIVTGPNTGGKTVSLKTLGLLTLMGQAGLHIPADAGSKLGVFTDVFADIGDEQSIEQSLSTFSAHMTNIVSILKEATPESLILFDELCSGTDPTEGAALGISILTFLHNMDCRVMATTHYSELKMFALQTDGIINASCEFNVETLSPTYHLLIGIPGKSNAFAISQKLGLPSYIIEDAKAKIDESNIAFEDILNELDANRREIERSRKETQKALMESDRLKKEYLDKLAKLEDRKEKEIKKAKEKAEGIILEAKEFADDTMKSIRKAAAKGNTKEIDRTRNKVSDKLKNTSSKKEMLTKKRKSAHKPSDFHIGDKVKVISFDSEGVVTSLPNAKGMVDIQMGIFKTSVPLSDLEIIDEPDIVANTKAIDKTGAGKIKISKSFSVSSEIKLLGMTVDEAISVLDKYLDDAYLAGLKQVRIVHGKGTGALRAGISEHLRRSSYVKNYHLALPEEGGAGVTICEFK